MKEQKYATKGVTNVKIPSPENLTREHQTHLLYWLRQKRDS